MQMPIKHWSTEVIRFPPFICKYIIPYTLYRNSSMWNCNLRNSIQPEGWIEPINNKNDHCGRCVYDIIIIYIVI